MMLSEKYDPLAAVDLLMADNASRERSIGQTVFEYPIDIVSPYFKQKDSNPAPPDTTDLPYDEPVFQASDPSNKFTASGVPTVLQLDLTDKSDKTVYEKIIDHFQPTDPEATIERAPPIDATILNNPSVDGLQTVNIGGSPLGVGYAGGNVYMQASDPRPYGPTPELATDDTQPATKPSDCAWYDVPCMFGTIKGEVTILIVGLILLTIGIFALTR